MGMHDGKSVWIGLYPKGALNGKTTERETITALLTYNLGQRDTYSVVLETPVKSVDGAMYWLESIGVHVQT